MKYKKLYLLCILAFLLYVSVFYYINKEHEFGAVDIVHNKFFSDLVSKEHTLKYFNDLNLKYEPNIFGARSFIIDTEDHYSLPASFLGFIIITGILKSIVPHIHYVINAILAVTAMVFFFRLAKEYYDKKTAYIGVILLMFLSSFIYWAGLYYNDIMATTFFLISVFYIHKSLSTNLMRYYLVFPLFMGLAIWSRYPMVISYVPLVLFLFGKHKFDYKKLGYSVLVFIITIIPLLILNYNLYGGIFNFSITLSDNVVLYPNALLEEGKSKPLWNKIVLFDGLEVLSKNLKFYIYLINIPLFIISILGFFVFLIGYNKRSLKSRFSLFLVLIAIINLFYYLGVKWSGYTFQSPSLFTPYARYIIPVYLIFIFISLGFISYFYTRNKKLLGILIVFYVISNLSFALDSDSGIRDLKSVNQNSDILSIREGIQSSPDNSIFFTNYYDKYIFPIRQTAIYATVPAESRIETTTRLIDRLTKDGYPVYFLDENHLKGYDVFEKEDYFEEFRKSNLQISSVNGRVYHIENEKN